MNKIYIIVKTNFEMVHHFPNAPIEVDFLKKPHRHIFHVEAKIPVSHEDRQLEFFIVKKFIDDIIQKSILPKQKYEAVPYSCEYMAGIILNSLSLTYQIKKDLSVSIFEDFENGGVVEI